MFFVKKIQNLNKKLIKAVEHKNSVRILFLWSMSESIFFPIPPDIGLIAMSGVNRNKAFYYAFVTTFSSVIGGLLGYMIGYYLYEWVGVLLIELYSFEELFKTYVEQFRNNGDIIVLIGAVTPIPYKLITVAGGVAHMNIINFIVFSFLGRAIRYFTVSTIVFFLGEYARKWLDEYFTIITFVIAFVTVIGFILIKYLI